MMETMSPQPAAGVGGIPQRRAKGPGRRESKVAYRNLPGYSTQRRNSASPANPSSPEQYHFSRINYSTYNHYDQIHGHGQGSDPELLGYYGVDHHPSVGSSNVNNNPIVHQNILDGNSWVPVSSQNPYTLALNLPASPQKYDGNHGHSPGSQVPQMSGSNGQEISWNMNTPHFNNMDSELDDISMSDMQLGTYGSFNSLAFSAARTTASSISDTYVFPNSNAMLDAAGNQIQDLALPNGFHRTGTSFATSSPGTVNTESPNLYTEDFPSGNLGSPISPKWICVDPVLYNMESWQWSATTLTAPHDTQQNHTMDNALDFQPDIPWNPNFIPGSPFQQDATPGGVTFEPPRGTPYHTHIARQQVLEAERSDINFLNWGGRSPSSENESKSWALVSNPGSSPKGSHDSPPSHNSSLSQVSSPAPEGIDIHSHIYNSISNLPRIKATRGRQRNLTDDEKKQARDVREAKACWACHISKTKCSPCSPGRPCEQCARLATKRRFCLFSCFNDPLETLSTFLVPNYLMGHFTKANVESFVTRNASSWGTQQMLIRMDWGYPKFLEAEVVALALRSGASEMGFFHQTVSNGGMRPQLVRKLSPPLGIPLAAMDEMQDEYSKYVQEIVQNGIAAYIPTAYIEPGSELPIRLLGAVASYYSAGNTNRNESELLRRALEMHVTSVILERSLFLDPSSLRRVQTHLNQEYDERSAPRCAQRQIKLAFFMVQRKRIQQVLKAWGSMIWATNPGTTKDKEWAVAFSVFLTLILVIDKTLGAAYYFCEGRIKHHSHDDSIERKSFQDLVRLTQKELFERCKEIFHWKFKTRKGGKEACNPIRDGIDGFHGKLKSVDKDVARFVKDLQGIIRDHELDVQSPRSSSTSDVEPEYTDGGRLARIFLDDFRSH